MADARHKFLFIRVLLEVTNFLALREIEFCVALLSLHNVSLEILVLSRTRLVILFDNVSVVAAARPLNLLVLFACARIILGAQRPLLGQIIFDLVLDAGSLTRMVARIIDHLKLLRLRDGHARQRKCIIIAVVLLWLV